MVSKNPDLPHMINLVLGDWSGDGHSKTETVTILSNLEKKDVAKAYKKGTKKVGFNLTEEVCAEYEDNNISREQVEKLAELGIPKDAYLDSYDLEQDEEDSEDGFSLWTNGFAELWLRIAQLGNPDFKYEVTTHDSPNINIGGYGMYE